jgi:hypothetical protein
LTILKHGIGSSISELKENLFLIIEFRQMFTRMSYGGMVSWSRCTVENVLQSRT